MTHPENETFEAYGLKCELKWFKLGSNYAHGNGYVTVPLSHPLADAGYDDVRSIRVHYGLTYSEKRADGRCFGFDTAHSGDHWPDTASAGSPRNKWSTDWTWEKLREETTELAKQLALTKWERRQVKGPEYAWFSADAPSEAND